MAPFNLAHGFDMKELMTVYDGYASGYTKEKVTECAEFVAERVNLLTRRHGTKPTIVVHGNSGVSVGFAALMLCDFHLVLLRKDNDNSHGSPIEGPNGHEIDRYYILDDFVSSGDTIRRVVNKINVLADARGYQRPTPMGTILYHGGRTVVNIADDLTLYPVEV